MFFSLAVECCLLLSLSLFFCPCTRWLYSFDYCAVLRVCHSLLLLVGDVMAHAEEPTAWSCEP